jgi:UDP-N-acetylmuramoyl-L-alanyl-D-glutamate--2,6-diaminopimelate ligase
MSKRLTELLQAIAPAVRQIGNGANDVAIDGLSTHSRQIESGQLFIGMPGTQTDGGRFWQEAADRGASAAFISTAVLETVPEHPTIPLWSWPAESMPMVCGQVASEFYGYPGHQLSLVGVTGTNGKTTTTHAIEHLLAAAAQPTALIGTLYERWPGHQREALHTTPFAPDLQQTLAAVLAAGCQWAVMEVSSHSLAQHRVWGCQFDAAVWTNLTQDHLDFHNTMEAYWQAKALLFQPQYLKDGGRAIVNCDDAGGQQLLATWTDAAHANHLPPWRFTLKDASDLSAAERENLLWAGDVAMDAVQTRARLHTPMGSIAIAAPLVGAFNLANLLAAVGVALHLGVDLPTIQAALTTFPGVPGRVMPVQVPGQTIATIVDYAHTPDGLQNLLQALRPSVQNKLVCVFGCGGDRDRRKRPLMGQIAATLADKIVVTSDNPRTENPQQILSDILQGIDRSSTDLAVEVDRKLAIEQAIANAAPGDTVVIAGKGHENYQILGKLKVHFDDREVALCALEQRFAP